VSVGKFQLLATPLSSTYDTAKSGRIHLPAFPLFLLSLVFILPFIPFLLVGSAFPALEARFRVSLSPAGKFLKTYIAPGEIIGHRIKLPSRLTTMVTGF